MLILAIALTVAAGIWAHLAVKADIAAALADAGAGQ